MAWIDAAQAVELMGVRPQTLYANVSRGRIRAKPDPRDPRRSLYHREDALRLAARRKGRSKSEQVAAESMDWGMPVLPSAITTVRDGRLWYRGRDAVALSAQAGLEDIAGLLWECAPPVLAAPRAGTAAALSGDPWSRALAAMAARCAADLPTLGRSAALLKEEAAQVLATLVDALFGAASGTSVSRRIAAAWRCPRAEPALRQALCLLADHELNASTFATRVTVSTGASLAAGVLSGLAALAGPLHGRAGMELAVLVKAVARDGAETAVRKYLREGRGLPAFGHPLYAEGDPRARALLASMPVPEAYGELAHWVERLAGELPNVDFCLSALAAAYKLPANAPLALFATGRCVGWLAHGLEQAQGGRLIRPRARYVGISPPPGPRRAGSIPGAWCGARGSSR